MKTGKKILIGFASVIVLVIIAVVVYWFSIPEGQRNMILFMAGSGNESYEEYVEYQVVDTNEETLEEFFNKSLSLCFAGEGLTQETEMVIHTYLNNQLLD